MFGCIPVLIEIDFVSFETVNNVSFWKFHHSHILPQQGVATQHPSMSPVTNPNFDSCY